MSERAGRTSIGRLAAHVCLVSALAFCFCASSRDSAQAQTAGKYEFYRYPQQFAAAFNPLGILLGRIDGFYEWRLDPNFSRRLEIAYQPNVQDKSKDGTSPESSISIGLTERLYLYDNGAIQAQFAGVGVGLALIRKTLGIRLTTEVGYKWVFGGGTSHFYVEPMVLLDAYVVTNYDGKRVLPYVELPIGYVW